MPTAPSSRVALAHGALLLAAMLFGGTFVVVKEAVEDLPPHAFLGWRFLLGAGALVLLGLVPRVGGGGLRWGRSSRAPLSRGRLPWGRLPWRDGLLAGLLLWGGYALQTMGLVHASASHSALITGLTVVFTPLLAAALARRRPRLAIVAGTLVAFAGLALLAAPSGLANGSSGSSGSNGSDGLRLGLGDLLTLGCAVFFAGHVLVLARTSRAHPTVPFTAIQLGVTCLGSFALSALLEGFPLPGRESWPALLLTGLAASAAAFLLQVWAQSVVGPARAVLILALETLFGALLGRFLLGELLGPLGLAGAALVLFAILGVLLVTSHDEDLPEAEAISPAH